MRAPVNYPPDPNPRDIRFRMPAKACDTHFHIFGPPDLYPYQELRQYNPPACPIEHYVAVANCIGLSRGVLTPSFAHGTDLTSMLAALERYPGMLKAIIWADPNLTRTDLARLDEKGVRGVRFNCVSRWEGKLDRDAVLHYMERLPSSWVVDFFMEGRGIPGLLGLVPEIDAPVVVDHFGGIDAKLGLNHELFQALLTLCGESNAWLKISGANRVMARGSTLEEVVEAAHAIGSRTERLIWGTDWPHTEVFAPRQMPNDGDLVNLLADLVPDSAFRNRILVDNPGKLFGFEL